MANFIETKEIETKSCIGIRKKGPYQTKMPEAWQELLPFIMGNNLCSEETMYLGLGYDDPNAVPAEEIRSCACITYDGDLELPDNIEKMDVFGGKYALYLHEGPYENLIHTYNDIYQNDLSARGLDWIESPCVESYLNNPMDTKPEDLRTHIYVAIK